MTLDLSALLRREAARFADVLRDADPAARVPSCPDWTAEDLLWHLGEVFTFWGTVVRDRLTDPDSAEVADADRPAEHAALLAFYDAAVSALITALENAPDDAHVWTWSADETVGFVRRRMTHEALIHRLDAELTVGAVTGIEADLAADGVHEALQHFYGGYPAWAPWSADGPVGRLRASDTGDEWTVRLGGFSGVSPNTGKSYDREPSLELVDSGEPAFTLTATARDLDAWVWNRPALAPPAVAGDRAAFARFDALIKKGIE